jgi:hypothetical protein
MTKGFTVSQQYSTVNHIQKPLYLLINAVVLKLWVATLLRVANCQKRVAKFDTKKKLTYIAENMAKIRVLTWYFSHLEGRKIP